MIIFAQTRHHYDSYIDLWLLVELSGFPIIYVSEIDWDSDNTYIISPLNGELPTPLPPRKCKVIWLCIERPSVYNEPKLGRPDFDELWVCDKNWAERVGARYFLMGSHPGLGYYEPNKMFDIACNTYNNPRRTGIWAQMEGYSFAPNSFNRPDNIYAASKICIVPQQDDPPHAVTPLRFAIAAAYHMPLVYEGECDSYPFMSGVHFKRSSYSDLALVSRDLLADSHVQEILGSNLHLRLCVDTNFRTEVERMFE